MIEIKQGQALASYKFESCHSCIYIYASAFVNNLTHIFFLSVPKSLNYEYVPP